MLDEIYKLDRRTGAIAVLLTLQANGETLLSDLYRKLKLDRTTTSRALDLLRTLGLVVVRPSDGFPFSKHLRLSRVGLQLVGTRLEDWPAFFMRRRMSLPQTRASNGATGERTTAAFSLHTLLLEWPETVERPDGGRNGSGALTDPRNIQRIVHSMNIVRAEYPPNGDERSGSSRPARQSRRGPPVA